MTDKRPNQESDPLVSRLYRESAQETAPPALNDAVLAEARRAANDGRSKYSRSIAWLRPMAWAATLGLSLAIVLELSMTPGMDANRIGDQPMSSPQSPPPQLSSPELPTPHSSSPHPAPTPLELAEPENDPRARRQDANRDRRELEEAVVNDTLAEPAVAISVDQPRVQADGRTAATESAPSPADSAPSLADDAAVKQELDRLMQLESRAAAKSTAEQASAEGAAMQLEHSAAYAIAVPCDEAQTETPERWLECIQALDETGRYADAAKERDRLIEAFPDFELPAPPN